MKRYAIWDKQSPIITPVGEVFTAEQWIQRYPVAAIESITVVCGVGEINGALFGTLGQMVQMYENQGADFSACETDEDKLAVIEAFEDAMNAAPEDTGESSPEERIAAALEFQNMMAMPDVNSDDPDVE